MKKQALVILTAAVFVGVMLWGIYTVTPSAEAETREDFIQTITVYGEAEMTDEPDFVEISLGVVTENRTAEEAVKENAAEMDSVVKALNEYGFDEDEIETASYRLSTYREDRRHDEEKETYFRASNEIIVTTGQLEEVGKIIDLAVEAGANEVRSINFDLKHPQELKEEALKAAVAQGNTKAEAIAESAGIEIKGIKAINEERTAYTPFRAEYPEVAEEALDDKPTTTPIHPEEVEVEARVKIDYYF